MNLFQVYDDLHQMVKKKYSLVFEYHLDIFVLLPTRWESFNNHFLIKMIFYVLINFYLFIDRKKFNEGNITIYYYHQI